MSQQNVIIDYDRNLALKDAYERKEELITQRYGYCNKKLLETPFETKYDVSFAMIIDIKDSWKIDRFIELFNHQITTQIDKEKIITYLYNFFTLEESNTNRNELLNGYDIFPKPLGIIKAFDRVVNVGLRRTAELVTGKSTKYYTDYAWGEGSSPVLPKDTKLQIEVARTPLVFAEPRGSEISFFGRTLENIPQADIRESGIFDGSNKENSSMFLRTRYGGTILTHQFQQDQVILMHLVYQLSV